MSDYHQPAKNDHRVRRGAVLSAASDRVQEQVAGDEDLGVVAEERFQPALDGHDPAELLGVVGDGLAVTFGIDDGACGRRDRRCLGAHNRSLLAALATILAGRYPAPVAGPPTRT